MIDACRNLEALNLTTPVLACLTRDGRIIGVVKCIEEGARMVSYKDRALVRADLGVLHFSDLAQVYTAFQKLQQRHIYLLDGHDMEPSAVLIVDDKVRFVDMALKRWFSPNVLVYDRSIHDGLQLKQARQSHWRQAEKLFERINTRPSTSNRYRTCEYRLINVICKPGMPLVTFSACPSAAHKRRKKRRKRSSEPQILSDDGEYLPGRDEPILPRCCRIRLNQHENFVRQPNPHTIHLATSLSSFNLSFSRSPSPSYSTSRDASFSMARHGSILQHHRMFYSDRSNPSPSCNGENVLESGWLEKFEF